MPARHTWCAASTLVARLLDDGSSALVEVTRTPVSVHYETGDPSVPVLSVVMPDAVHLPASLVASRLPDGEAWVREGALESRSGRWRVARWWIPPRPHRLLLRTEPGVLSELAEQVRARLPCPAAAYDAVDPGALVGSGPGLTPAGDDVLAAALVTARAFDDPRWATWRRATRSALDARSTTAVSRALLHHALDGWATSELGDFLLALAGRRPLEPALHRLLAVGHTSGTALVAGALRALMPAQVRGAA